MSQIQTYVLQPQYGSCKKFFFLILEENLWVGVVVQANMRFQSQQMSICDICP